MNEKDRRTFFQQIQPKISKPEYAKLLGIFLDLENKNTELRRKNQELRNKLKLKSK